ncbi:MAG TPA: hypothetical protein VMU85_13855 [Stellaceae bacterium]|nr:hypothetical protein [Stellaceae bacterium]
MARLIRVRLSAALLLLAGGVAAAGAQTAPSTGQPGTRPTPVPDVPSVGPDIYSTSPPPGVQRTAPSTPPAHYAPPPNAGPVTGYGPGGMTAAPGAPANPPYSYGGTAGQPPR